MRQTRRISGMMLALCLLLLPCCSVLAAEEEYTYTVRFFSGAQGTIDGKEMIVKKKLHYGERVTFSQRQVALHDGSKYYVKGIRESGKDNNTAVSTSSFPVEGDMDYVVVYGLLGNSVAYTVNYVDAAGNTLAPSETYYGNVGDEPVVAFLYIEGYQPQAYNLTGTLKENAADNVFNFVYTPAATPAPPQQPAAPGTATIAPPAATAAPGTPGTQPGTTAPAGEAGEAAEGEEGGAGEGEAAEEGTQEGGNEGAEAEGEAENAGPQELERIDDEEAPLANTDLGMGNNAVDAKDFARRLADFPLAAKAGICAAVLLAVGAAAWFLLFRKKKPAEADSE